MGGKRTRSHVPREFIERRRRIAATFREAERVLATHGLIPTV